MEKSFCENCRKFVTPTIHKRPTMFVVRNKNIVIDFIEKYAICPMCGEEVYVHKINDENIKEINRQYLLGFVKDDNSDKK